MKHSIFVLPWARKMKEFDEPLDAISATAQASHSGLFGNIVRGVTGRVVTRVCPFDGSVALDLDSGMRLWIRATEQTPLCDVHLQEPADDLPPGPRTLSDVVQVTWSSGRAAQWTRRTLIDDVVGRSIVRLQAPGFGVLFHLSGGVTVCFSSMLERGTRTAILYWGPME